MKTPVHPAKSGRFNAPVRHYHRAGAKSPVAWDEWVDGSPAASKSPVRSRAMPLFFLLLGLVAGAVLLIVIFAG